MIPPVNPSTAKISHNQRCCSSHIFSEEAFLRVLSHEVPCMPSCPQNKPSWNPSWESQTICMIFNSCLNLTLKHKNVKNNNLGEKAATVLVPKDPGEDQMCKIHWRTALAVALFPGESRPLSLFQGSLIEGVPGTLVPLQLSMFSKGTARGSSPAKASSTRSSKTSPSLSREGFSTLPCIYLARRKQKETREHTHMEPLLNLN